MSSEHEDDCDCASCDTLIMRPDPDWTPMRAAPGVTGRCVFCRSTGQVDHYTSFGDNVCVPCAAKF